REDGFSPDVVTYSSLINCLASARQWRRAVAILDEMILLGGEEGGGEGGRGKKRGGEGGGVRPDAHCFNAAISACAKVRAGQWQEAERLVQEMQRQGLSPDHYTYNSLTNAYASSGQWKRALATLQEMRDSGVRVNGMAYSAAIK
ncbi:unnamed protein product, partial [Discosporangium mesarthrocarpum]